MSGPPKSDRAKRHGIAFSGRLEPLDQEAGGSATVSVDLVDLSTSGAGIICPTALDNGSVWRLCLDPELCDDFIETVVVKRCVQEGESYRCGVQFVSAAALFAKAGIGLEAVVQDLGINRAQVVGEKTAAGRATATALLSFDDSAVVEQMANLRVTSSHPLTVNNNMAGCEAQLAGPLQVRGQLAGGSIKTSSTIEAAILGQAGSITRVVLGSLPKANPLITQVPKQLDVFDTQIEDKNKELAYISNHGNEIGHNARERVMELKYEVEEIVGKRKLLQEKYDALLSLYNEKIEVDLRVHDAIEPGVVIEYLTARYKINRRIPGPLQVLPGADQALMITLPNQGAQPLVEVLDINEQKPMACKTGEM